MKRWFLGILLILAINLKAQYLNLSMGINLSAQQREKYPALNDRLFVMIGFNSQFSYDLNIWKSVYLGYEIGFNQVGIEYKLTGYNESFSYLSLSGYLKLRSHYIPLYMSIGGYGAILMAASAGDGQQVQPLDLENYKFYDYGFVPTIGLAVEFDFFMYFVELKYRVGTVDIYKSSNNSIYNRALGFSFGISFIVH